MIGIHQNQFCRTSNFYAFVCATEKYCKVKSVSIKVRRPNKDINAGSSGGTVIIFHMGDFGIICCITKLLSLQKQSTWGTNCIQKIDVVGSYTAFYAILAHIYLAKSSSGHR